MTLIWQGDHRVSPIEDLRLLRAKGLGQPSTVQHSARLQKQEKIMPINPRFVLDENRYVIDKLNPDSQKGYCHEDSPDDQFHLRERVLMVRLSKLVDDLIINLQPERTSPGGKLYRPFNSDSHAIWVAILAAIQASHLNTSDLSASIQTRFDGRLKRKRRGLQGFTSLSLFLDDVECLLRDMYRDVGPEALDHILWAVFTIVREFLHYVRKDLWQEHQNAMDSDYNFGIGVPEGCGISGSEWRRGMVATSNLRVRAREVRKDPAAFSKYTVRFVEGLKPDEVDDQSDSLNPCDAEIENWESDGNVPF
jgi:hypothetical protein